MPIDPDTKDWTWVLERPCDECGFDASALPAATVPALVRGNVTQWRPLLLAGDGTPRPGVAERPSDDRWSAIEYACHVRDVFRLYDERLALMLTRRNPTFPNWDQDETAVSDRYIEQAPVQVLAGLEAAGQLITAMPDGQRERADEVRPAADRIERRSGAGPQELSGQVEEDALV